MQYIHSFLRYLLNTYFAPGTGSGPGAYRDEKDPFMPSRSEGKTVISYNTGIQLLQWWLRGDSDKFILGGLLRRGGGWWSQKVSSSGNYVG